MTVASSGTNGEVVTVVIAVTAVIEVIAVTAVIAAHSFLFILLLNTTLLVIHP
jgi:hypothetical protein